MKTQQEVKRGGQSATHDSPAVTGTRDARQLTGGTNERRWEMSQPMERTLITAVLCLIVFALGDSQSARSQIRIINPGSSLQSPPPPPPPPALDQSFLKPQPWGTEMTYARGWNGEHPRMLADVNGDGKQDLVGFGNDGVWLATSTGTQFNTAFVLAAFGYNSGWTSENHVRITGDINGDKRDDIVAFGDAGVYRALSTGTGFGPPTFVVAGFGYNDGWRVNQHVRLLADVNGDGMKDIVGFGNDGVWLSLATPGGYFTAPSFVLAAFGNNSGWTNANHVRTMADVNGDGMQDIVGFGNDGVWVALSTGTGFGPPQFVLSGFSYYQGWTPAKHIRTMADINRDGKQDIVGFGDDGVWVALSTGNGFAPAQLMIAGFGYNQGWRVDKHPRFVADLNGDGYLDIVGYGEEAVQRALGGPGWFGGGTPVLRALVRTEYLAADPRYSPDFIVRPDLFPRLVGDVNGDGMADLVAFNPVYQVAVPSTPLPPPPPPSEPANPRFTATTTSSLSIAWDDNVGDERQFFINYGESGDTGSQRIAVGAGLGTSTYVLGSLALGTRYCFNVQAENIWGVSDSTSTQCGRTNQVLTITTSSVPAGQVGSAYSQTLAASGGIPPYAWAVISGSLPNGLTLNSSGVLSGTPSAAGSFHFTVQVRDSQPTTFSRDFTLTINGLAAGFSSVDVFNCISEGGSVNVWTQDLAQGSWVERGTAPALWNAGTCPGSAAPFVVPLQDGHRFWFAVVDPQLPACGVDNPEISACQRQIFTSPLIGNAKGPALPDRVD